MSEDILNLETKLVHSGEPKPRISGAVCAPIFQSSTYEACEESDYHAVRYIRLNNTPNHLALNEKLAAIENAEDAVVTASGMAAITAALLALLSSGDHILAHRCLYGGTYGLLTQDLAALGISHDFVDTNYAQDWDKQLKPTTRAIYVETITNPLMEVGDLKAVVEFARRHGLLAIIDNTFASPVNFRPIEHGFDLSIHSGTKYLNGHSDIVAGVCIGSKELIARIKRKLDHLGGSLDPHAAFLLNRGLKTLALRVWQQNRSAQAIAEFLAGHPAVSKVNYPGLPTHPHYERAGTLLDGFGGMLSFELAGDLEWTRGMLSRLRIPANAPSLGGVETLITRPATTSHLGMTREERLGLGVSDSLLRLSVGIESTDDLIQDFSQALNGL